MHITEYGAEHARTLLFLPCTAEPVWAFSATVALLARRWHVFQVSYDGHEPAYPGDFLSVEQTVAEIMLWLRSRGITWLDAAYGLSLIHILNDTLDLLLIAVRPDLQKKGVNAVIINKVMKASVKMGIKHAETGPMLETNEAIQSQWYDFPVEQHKRCLLYTSLRQ